MAPVVGVRPLEHGTVWLGSGRIGLAMASHAVSGVTRPGESLVGTFGVVDAVEFVNLGPAVRASEAAMGLTLFGGHRVRRLVPSD